MKPTVSGRAGLERESTLSAYDTQFSHKPNRPGHSSSSSSSGLSSGSSSYTSASSSGLASSSLVGRSRFESDLQQLLQRYNLSGLDTSGRSISGQNGSQLHRLNFTSSYGQRVSVNDSAGFREGPMKWQNHTYAWAKNESDSKEMTGRHPLISPVVLDNEIDEYEPDDYYRSHRFLVPPTSMDNRNPLQLFGMNIYTRMNTNSSMQGGMGNF